MGKKARFVLIVTSFIILMFASNAYCDVLEQLNGTWPMDAERTLNSLVNSSDPQIRTNFRSAQDKRAAIEVFSHSFMRINTKTKTFTLLFHEGFESPYRVVKISGNSVIINCGANDSKITLINQRQAKIELGPGMTLFFKR